MTERYISPYPLPTPAERELLNILIEEAAEVIQRATKALRFGLQEIQPGQELTNAVRLAHEVGDFVEISNRCTEQGLYELGDVYAGMSHKREQLAKYLQHQEG